jgi:hypothetical protein
VIAHVVQFLVLSWIASLVYHGLRNDSVRDAAVAGTRRFVSFGILALGFGVALQLFTRWV